ncbi:MAG TPA: hypothetical protein VHC49_05285 [Mycobacteriales bacterium]|nr:hypothetical protein [Mycobacteriales bacterium]
MAATVRPQARSEIVIGVVGARDLVERIVLMGSEGETPDWRLVGASHAHEQETYETLRRIENSIDVVLFTGPLQYDLARQAGELPVPATYVPISGASLYSSLLRGTVNHDCDPARVSIDSIPPADVEEAYAEIGVDIDGVHMLEYQRPESAKQFIAFHEKLYRQGKTTAALTTVRSVAQKLQADGIPALRMMPTKDTLRTALSTAALQGAGNKLEEAQIAIVIVEVAVSARPGHAGPSNYWQQELKLSLHRSLLADARRMGATVTSRDENSYLVTATVGSLSQATDGLRAAPFLDRVQSELGLAVEVGIGLGRTARDAEAHALVAVEKARSADAAAYLVSADGAVLTLPSRPHRKYGEPDPAPESKGLHVLRRLVDGLPAGELPTVVDADTVAQLLGVTSRSARRTLAGLVDAGLAWPMPGARSTQAGRPPQSYRLVTEKLPDQAEP